MMILRLTHRRFLVPLMLGLLLSGLVLPAPAALAATTRHVTDCGDAGANTLRGQIAAAAGGGHDRLRSGLRDHSWRRGRWF